MPNIFKAQLVFVNHKLPFVPEIRQKAESQSHLRMVTDDSDSRVAFEKEIDMMLIQARSQACDVINQANFEAQEILTQSLIQSDNIKEEARLNGYEHGFNQGLISAKEECVPLINEVLSMREQMIDERSRLYSDFEKDMVKLSLEISKKVIYEQLSEDDEAFVKLVQSTVQKVRGVDFAKIWVSPVDHARLADLREALLSGLKSIKDVDILRGDSIKSLGCIVDTENGVLDGGVETRIAQIQEALIPENSKVSL